MQSIPEQNDNCSLKTTTKRHEKVIELKTSNLLYTIIII